MEIWNCERFCRPKRIDPVEQTTGLINIIVTGALEVCCGPRDVDAPGGVEVRSSGALFVRISSLSFLKALSANRSQRFALPGPYEERKVIISRAHVT